MMAKIFTKASQRPTTNVFLQFNQKREIHSRNKQAKEFIAKGWSAIQEVDRVMEGSEWKDIRLVPYLKTAKDNFELALEVDSTNTDARYWLARLHIKYHVPQACKGVGAALLIEAADMGHRDAQFYLGSLLRYDDPYVLSDHEPFYYLRKAADQFHPGALFVLGIVYLTGDCVIKDVDKALWYFYKASEKGNAGAAIAFGSLLLKGAEVPESVKKLRAKKPPFFRRLRDGAESRSMDRLEMAKEQFEIAIKDGSEMGLKWLDVVEEKMKNLESQS